MYGRSKANKNLWKFQKAAFYASNFMRGQSFVLSILYLTFKWLNENPF